jgi:hypothetical protein
VKPSIPVLALCVLCLNACGNGVNSDSEAASDTEQASAVRVESFTPRELTVADMPSDIQEGSWARLPTVSHDTLSPDDQRRFDVVVNPGRVPERDLAELPGLHVHHPHPILPLAGVPQRLFVRGQGGDGSGTDSAPQGKTGVVAGGSRRFVPCS